MPERENEALADPIRGRCLCGAVEFQLLRPLGEITHCHCRSCRLSRGVAFVSWTAVPPERFAFCEGEAELSWYRSSAGVSWGFCRKCGSSMLYVADGPGHPDVSHPGSVYVSVGSLTDEVAEMPVAHVSYEERVAWHQVSDTLPKFRAKSDERIGQTQFAGSGDHGLVNLRK